MVVKVSKLEVDFLSVFFYYFGLDCWGFLTAVTPVTFYLCNLYFSKVNAIPLPWFVYHLSVLFL